MKLIDLTCSKCGASLQVNPELTKCMCQYYGNEMLIDNEVQHHSLDNGFEFGYQAEMGRQQAQQEMQRQAIIQRQQIINEQNRRSQQIAEEHKQRTFHIWTIVLLIIYPFIGIPMMFFDKRFNKDNRKIPIIIWSTIIIIGLISSSNYKTDQETIVHPPYTSSEAKGKQYTEVIQAYQNAGFTNISFEKIDDLVFGWLTEDGEVEKVEINGNTEYTIETAYKQNEAKVIIYYHTFPEKTETTNNTEEQIEENTETTDTTLDDIVNENNTTEKTESNEESTNNIVKFTDDIVYIEGAINTIFEKSKGLEPVYYSSVYIEVEGIELNIQTDNIEGSTVLVNRPVGGTASLTDTYFHVWAKENMDSDLLTEGTYIRAYGKSYSAGGFLTNAMLNDCYKIEILDNNKNVISTYEYSGENMKSVSYAVTATKILKLAENQNFEGLPFNASTKEIYDVYDNKRVTISGTIEDIQYDNIYLNCNDEGYNSVGADTTLVVYCKVKDLSKYNIGQEVSITGTANCYRYSVIINEE